MKTKSKTIEFQQECQSCNGTGLYIGMAERDGSSVVCHHCKGTGEVTFKHSYNEFTGRKKPEKEIKIVVETNPGIAIGNGHGCKLENFGGLSFDDWDKGKPFPPGSEMRKYTCPAWWYQSANYKLKPNWAECGFGVFSACKHFGSKELCWERWDTENNNP